MYGPLLTFSMWKFIRKIQSVFLVTFWSVSAKPSFRLSVMVGFFLTFHQSCCDHSVMCPLLSLSVFLVHQFCGLQTGNLNFFEFFFKIWLKSWGMQFFFVCLRYKFSFVPNWVEWKCCIMKFSVKPELDFSFSQGFACFGFLRLKLFDHVVNSQKTQCFFE